MNPFIAISSAMLLLAPSDIPQQIELPDGAVDLLQSGRYERAEIMLRAAVEACIAADQTHATCISLLNTLAYTGQMRGDWKLQLSAAERSAVAAAKHAPGSEHEYYALTNLSSALEDSDTPMAAIAPGRKALALAERIWSPTSAQVALISRNLAITLTGLGRHAEAEPLMRRSYEIRVALDGADSISALDAARVLAVTLSEGGKIAAALELHARTVATLNERHPDRVGERASAAGDYALTLSNAGQYGDAAKQFSTAIALWRSLGGDQPGLLTALNNAAGNFSAMGDYASAEAMHREVLHERAARHSPDDPVMATSYGNLGVAIDAQGRHDEALPMFRKALDIAVKTYGADHIRTVPFRAHLADLLPPSEEAVERATLLAIRRKSLGPDHPDTLEALHSYATALTKAGRDTDAEGGFREAVERGTRVYGADNVNLAESMAALALCLARQMKPGSLAEMKSLLARSWTIHADVLGDHHTRTILSAVYLGSVSAPPVARTLSLRAQKGVLERTARQRAFDAAAQQELRDFAPIFSQGVAVNWRLANPPPAIPASPKPQAAN